MGLDSNIEVPPLHVLLGFVNIVVTSVGSLCAHRSSLVDREPMSSEKIGPFIRHYAECLHSVCTILMQNAKISYLVPLAVFLYEK